MQLKKKNKSIYQNLTVATCTLLSTTPHIVHAHEVEGKDLDYSTAFLDYVESDRVRVREIDQTIKWQMNDDVILSGSFIFDSITGSTPSGALSLQGVVDQTTTTASGAAGATGSAGPGTNAGGSFLDSLVPIVDRRVAFTGQVLKKINRKTSYSVGGLFSREDDYTSIGANGSFIAELNNKLTTLQAGLATTYDLVQAEDGGPKPGLALVGTTNFAFDDGEKRTIDANISLTQILNHRTVTKLGLSLGKVDGYLSDPYKVVTLATSVPSASGQDVLLTQQYFYEKRPDTRFRNALTFDMSHQPYEDDVLQVGYRYFWDDWDVKSHTINLRYRHQMGRNYLEPHIRLYSQTAADFFTPYLLTNNNEDPNAPGTPSGINAPEFASADPRLDKMNAITLGVKFGIEGPLGHFRIRAEAMQQNGSVGEFKDLSAYIFQIAWTINLE